MDTQLSSSASQRNLVRGQQGQEDELISTQNNVDRDAKQHSKTQAGSRNMVRKAVEQLRYPCYFNDFVEDLKGQENKLEETWKGVDKGVKHSKSQVLDVPVVHVWLDQKAKPLKANVEKLLDEATTRANKRCCFVRFPNWIWRYHMAKKLAEKKWEVESCIKEGVLYIKLEDSVSSRVTQNLPSEKSLVFDSRKGAYEKLLEALKDDKVFMIGLYGMGGCGKTTMAMEVKRTAEAERLFDEVAFVTVSNNNKVEVRSIQDKVARAIGFPFPSDGEKERAKELNTRLSLEHKRILLILDDVWQELNLVAMGIPSGVNHKNCKVLITTRNVEVCTKMNCQRMSNILILTDEEAWALFRKQAHISEGTFDNLKRLGRLISDECKGLPVAISALAGTLEGKDEKDWKDALNTLKSPIPMDINDADLQVPYKCLRLSYDNLDSEEAKSLLLLCSVFPEDFEIPVENLTRIAIGLGLVGEVSSFEEARDKVSAAKKKLISSSLLLLSDADDDDDDEGACVKMHDLVRDVALWIAGKENKVIKCLLEEDVTLECTSSIRYLFCQKFSNELDYFSIEFLYITTSSEVPDGIFKGMGTLRVLFLCWNGRGRGSLSTMSFKSLINLRCLFLSEWELGDISFLGHMTKLESLTMRDCSFVELPNVVVTHLTELRLLHISTCPMKENPFEVIGRHPRLEEMYFVEEFDERPEWYFDNEDHTECFKKFNGPQTLRRYRIQLDSRYGYHEYTILNDLYRILDLSCLDTSNAAIMDLAERAEVLRVSNIKGGQKNLIPEIFRIKEGGRDMNHYGWIQLWLCKSEKIECLINTINHHPLEVETLLSKLRKLTIQQMVYLGALYRGVPPSGLFDKLEQLHINDCPMMTCLFTHAVARSLVQVETLKIMSCPQLVHIIRDDDSKGEEISRHDNRLVFSKLKRLVIHRCEMLECIIPVTFAQGLVQLVSIDISDCFELKYVFGQSTREDQIQNIDLNIELPALESLKLTKNSKMTSIFPDYCCSAKWPLLHVFELNKCPDFDIMTVNTFRLSNLKMSRLSAIEKHFLNLKSLSIDSNSKIESIFSLNELEKIVQPVNLQIKYLNLKDLDQMKYFCAGLKSSFTLQNLKTLQIKRCDKLEVIFPASVMRCLPELLNLEIRECQELKKIFEEEDVDDNKNSNIVSSATQPCFPKLKSFIIKDCHNLKHLFSVTASNGLPNLKFLIIIGVRELEELLGCEQAGQGDVIGKVKVELPNLQIVVLRNLSSLCQRIEFPTQTTCFVHDCPKLSLSSPIATREEFKQELDVLLKDGIPTAVYLEMREITRYVCESPLEDTGLGETGTTSEISESIEGKVKESVQEGSTPEDTTKATMPASAEGNGLGTITVATYPETGTSHSQSQKMQNADVSIQEGSNLMDKEGEIGVVSNGGIEVHPEVREVRQVLYELEDIRETGSTFEISQNNEHKTKERVQHVSISEETMKATMIADTENNGSGTAVVTRTETGTLQCQKMQNVDNSFQEGSNLIAFRLENPDKSIMQKHLGETRSITEMPQTEIKLNQVEKYTDRESEGHPIHIKDFEDDDPVSNFGQISTPSVFVLTEDHPAAEDNLVAKVIADVEESLKMPLKDIAGSEANSLRLLTALKFLYHLPLEDVALSGGLKAIIESLHQELPRTLCSFKQAFVVTHKFAVLEEKERFIKEELSHRNEVAIKAKEKEEILEKEPKGFEAADLSSLQTRKNKCIGELRKELENVTRDKSQMLEDQKRARRQLF